MSESVQKAGSDSPAKWDETNGWRQGSVLPRETAISLDLVAPTDKDQFAMVISHDCDCAADPTKEPDVEIVIGALIKKLDGSLTFAKSTRKLHLELSECDKLIELKISTRTKVSKKHLATRPDKTWIINSDEKSVLALWLAARYSRGSFPTALVNRLDQVKKEFKEKADKYAIPAIGIFVDFDPENEVSNENEPYTFNISVVFDDRVADAEKTCLKLCAELKTVFSEAYKNSDDDTWTSIELGTCQAFADTQFTYRESRTKRLYRFDDLSLKGKPQGPLPT